MTVTVQTGLIVNRRSDRSCHKSPLAGVSMWDIHGSRVGRPGDLHVHRKQRLDCDPR
jgi:hypothetical protein